MLGKCSQNTFTIILLCIIILLTFLLFYFILLFITISYFTIIIRSKKADQTLQTF